MRIPTRFTLVNRDYKVIHTPPNQATGDDAEYGACFTDIGVIHLDKAGCPDRTLLEQTFLHELLHACLSAVGKPKLSDDEALVDSLAAVMHQYMKSHTGDFDDEYLYHDIPY